MATMAGFTRYEDTRQGPVLSGVPLINANVATDGTLELVETGERQAHRRHGLRWRHRPPMELILRPRPTIIGHCRFRLATVRRPSSNALGEGPVGDEVFEIEVIPATTCWGPASCRGPTPSSPSTSRASKCDLEG